MQVILLKDVRHLGKKGDVKNVADGFARNFLFPRRLAEPATSESMQRIEAARAIDKKRAEDELVLAQSMVEKLDGLDLPISANVNEKGELYAAIGKEQIIEELRGRGHLVSKEQIILKRPFKQVGDFPVTLTFNDGLEAEIHVVITEEK